MNLNSKYNIITSNTNNINILNNIIIYISKLFSINKEELYNKSKYYIKELLYEVKKNNNEAVILRKQRQRKQDDIKYFESSLVSSQGSDGVNVGKNTGGHKNMYELKLYEIAELKDELEKLVMESLLLEKTLEANNKLIRDFINLIPQRQYIAVLEYTYFEGLKGTEIANELNYSCEYIKQARIRSIAILSELIKKSLKSELDNLL